MSPRGIFNTNQRFPLSEPAPVVSFSSLFCFHFVLSFYAKFIEMHGLQADNVKDPVDKEMMHLCFMMSANAGLVLYNAHKPEGMTKGFAATGFVAMVLFSARMCLHERLMKIHTRSIDAHACTD